MSELTATQNAPLDQVQPAVPVVAAREEPTANESAKDKVAAEPEVAVEVSKPEAPEATTEKPKEEVPVTEDAPKVEMANTSTLPATAAPAEGSAASAPAAGAVDTAPAIDTTAVSEKALAPEGVPAEEKKGEAEEKEPQNTLTGHFTEAEWKALKEFRVSWAIICFFCRL